MTVVESGSSKRVTGTRMLRREDPALLTGEAKFIDDIVQTDALYMVLLRSPMAHARIISVDSSAAKRMPGVVAVFSGSDLRGEWLAPMPCAWPVTVDMKNPPHYPVAADVVNYVGDAVAVVLASDKIAAVDALAAIDVNYEPLPVVSNLEDALADKNLVHPALGTNTSYVWNLEPDKAKVDSAFASAEHVVRSRFVQQRLIPSAMETRGVLAVPHPYGGEYTLFSSTQIPHILKTMLSLTVGISEAKLRVIAPSVGGGFGSKLNVYSEEVLALTLARKLHKPIRWTEERSENSLATIHGRGQIQDVELAADADGKIMAVRVNLVADMGGYLQLLTPGVPLLGGFLYHGLYDVPAYSFTCTGVFTNKTPTDAYRGAGRPEATFAIERSMDALAKRVGVDPAEIRRRNFIAPEKFPYSSAPGLVFDSGNYLPNLEMALEKIGYKEIRAEQERRRAEGSRKHLGVGLSCYVEMCGLAPSKVLGSLSYSAGGWESATVRILPTCKVQVVTGTSPHGQGHETSWSMIVADRLGINTADIEVLHSDTAIAPYGLDTYGSRSLAVGGSAVYLATEKVLEKAKLIAAHALEVSPEDLDYQDGEFKVKGSAGKSYALSSAALEAFTAHDLPEGVEPNLEATVTWDPPNFTFPFGTHIAVVEVDEETGQTDLLRYLSIDDVGNQINPMIVDGQIEGGIAQGVAQALFEEAVYDESCNLLDSTFIEYLMPSAAEFPSFELGNTVTPSPTNPLGVKGVGEAGCIASPPAVINAVVDALAEFGIEHIDMPASPEKVWSAIELARLSGTRVD
ncbi:MAG: xanthine dehydrogenase family protein molybdopterin-binding subunit [Actinomycetota bacterium]|nr:MAG: xanthine dehydrogenase family protein molybdopterin-binding subunit [Actinomycetota bacterium]